MPLPAETEAIRADFDRIAAFPEPGWDHNAHYHDFLLSHLPAQFPAALDVGCGTGAFTRRLAERADRVLGIDLSEGMIEAAGQHPDAAPNVAYEVADVMAREGPEDGFDCVASIATLHHLPLEEFLRRLRALLRPGGTLVVLDLRSGRRPLDVLMGAVAVPVGLALRAVHTGRLREAPEVRAAWAAHGAGETYPTIAEVRRACAAVLPGARVRRHLLWRYSIVWQA